MTDQRTLTITSLLLILLFSLHWADEISRGMEPGTIDRTLGGLLILFIWFTERSRSRNGAWDSPSSCWDRCLRLVSPSST